VTDEQVFLLSKADERLDAARHLLKGGFYDDAVSRSYYAVFFAAHAAIAEYGERPKTHAGVSIAFGKYLVKPGHLPKDMGRTFREIMDMRQLASYEGTDLSKEALHRLLASAEEFISNVHDHLA